jgi:hypothetical protein
MKHLLAALCLTLALVGGCAVEGAKPLIATPTTRPAPATLAAPVSLGIFPVTLIGPRHGVMAWHCRWMGQARWPNGETATITGLRRIGTSDICVAVLDRAVSVKPAVICPEGAGWFRRPGGTLKRTTTKRYHNQWTTWPNIGLVNGESSSPHLRDYSGRVGIDTFATSYTSGPALWYYRTKIMEAAK